ncbi:BamA/TamA family outer membrane protein [bacterium]|nr:BamA/TamA family outer membrane protein [bacterium]
MRKVKILLILLLFFAFADIFAEETVSEIIWESPLPKSEFSSLIKIKRGEPLSIKKIRRTVKLLYATRKFQQVSVYSEKRGGSEVAVRIEAEPQLIIVDTKISGNSKFTRREIKLAAGIEKYGLFFEDNLPKIRDEIIYFYQQNGFFEVLVNIAGEKLSASEVILTINITEGPQSKIRAFDLVGKLYKSEKRRLTYELETKFKNEPYTDKNINEVALFVSDYYKEKGFLDVSAAPTKLGKGVVQLNIQKGSLYRTEIRGVYYFAPITIRKIVESFTNYQNNLKSVKRKISDFYNAYAFHDAEIKITTDEKNVPGRLPRRIITIDIKENRRRFINNIVLDGATEENRKIVVKRLTDFIDKKIDEEDFPQTKISRTHTGGGFSDSDGSRADVTKDSMTDKVERPDSPTGIPKTYLEDIRDVVEKVYRNQGYMECEISEAKIIETPEGELELSMQVTENTQYMLTEVTAETGNPEYDRLIKKKIKLPKALPFNDDIVDAYKKRVSDFLTDKGYLFNFVTYETKFNGSSVRVEFRAEYLFRVKVTEVVLAGNYLTSSWVVRHILRIDPNDTLDGDSLTYSRRNLLQTGVFQMVEINFIDPETPNPEKDIVVFVSESDRFRVSPGIGVSTDDGARLTGVFEWNNMIGSSISSKLSLKLSRKIELFMFNSKFKKHYSKDFTKAQHLERKINLSFLIPDLFIPKLPLSFQIDAFHMHYIKSNVGLPYMIDKNGLYFSFFRRFNMNYFISTGVEVAYQYEKDYNIAEGGEVSYEKLNRLVVSPEIRGYLDFRNSPFFPTKGWKLALRYVNKSSVYGDKNRFSQIEGNIAVYIPLTYRVNFAGDREPLNRIIFHSYIQSAFLIPHSGKLSSDDVLKLGGNTTIRGFYTDELAPNDQKEEAPEGKFYMFMRNELRFRVISDLYIVGFFDFGNLWEEVSHVGDGEIFRYASGGGLLYASPIGSITAQVGFNLKPREGENVWTFHIYLSTL